MKTVLSYLGGIILSGLGTILLTVSLEQILDPEGVAELFGRAGVAALTGAGLVVAGALLTVIAAWASKSGEKWRTARTVMALISTSAGVALSLAASLAISAIAAMVIETGAGAAVAVLGTACIAGGYFLARGFWMKLGTQLLTVIRPPASPATGSTSTSPNASGNPAATSQP